MSNFANDALAVLAGGLPALNDGINGPTNAFPEQTPPTGTVQNYEPGLFNTQSSGLSNSSLVVIGLGLAALLTVVVLATR